MRNVLEGDARQVTLNLPILRLKTVEQTMHHHSTLKGHSTHVRAYGVKKRIIAIFGVDNLLHLMASPDPREKPLEELEKEITCAVCHGFYQKAKLLPCNHYYCSTCIEKMAARSRGGPFDCPECRKETSLPAGGVAGLQPAFFVERIKDLHGKMARAEGKVEALCEQCAGEKSVAFCRQCAEFICGNCSRSHTKMKVFSGHVVASLEDLKKGGVKNIPLKESPAAACADHGEPMIFFFFFFFFL